MAKTGRKSIYCLLVEDVFCRVFDYTPSLYVGAQGFVLPLYA
jgi:hypothetical protein